MQPLEFKKETPKDLTSVQIEGERIILVSLNETYASDLFKEFTPEITRYMIPKSPEKIEETLDYIKGALKAMESGEELVLVILKKEDGSFLGGCGLHGMGKIKTPALGIWIKKDAHGNKYGQEAIHTLSFWAAQHIHFDYLIYPVDKVNFPSRKIPESLGGTIFKESQIKLINGNMSDEVVYKIPYENLKVAP